VRRSPARWSLQLWHTNEPYEVKLEEIWIFGHPRVSKEVPVVLKPSVFALRSMPLRQTAEQLRGFMREDRTILCGYADLTTPPKLEVDWSK